MKFKTRIVHVLPLFILFPTISSLAVTFHLLPNSTFLESFRFTGERSGEMETRARENENEERRFRIDERTKADWALIESAVATLKSFSVNQIEAVLGPRQEVPVNYILPACSYSGLTVSGHQDSGGYVTAFFPIGQLGGAYVIQYEKRDTISAGAIYLKRDHSYKVGHREGKARESARESERRELEAIKAALEKTFKSDPARTDSAPR